MYSKEESYEKHEEIFSVMFDGGNGSIHGSVRFLSLIHI